MSHGKIREDKTCLNCGHQVEEHYCTHCGQENVETRQPFYFLFTHFIEDFLHYDGSFWQTIKKLFLKPGELTKEYLSGKRNSSVNPVKMYIFVSFVTFFLISIFPSHKSEYSEAPKVETSTIELEKAVNAISDTIQNKGYTTAEQNAKIKAEFNKNKDANSLEELNIETIETVESETQKSVPILTPIIKKYKELKQKKISDKEIGKAIIEKTMHIIPKALFVYMPLFAFLLWIFYNKKKWWYFDHGIFTLHYFTVILLSILVIFLLNKISTLLDISAITSIIFLLNTIIVLYIISYFYIGLYKLYNQGIVVSFIKGFVVLSINTLIFYFIVTAILVYSYLNV